MNKLKGNIWTKIIGLILICVSVLGITYGSLCMYLFTTLGPSAGDKEKIEQQMWERVSANYGMKLIDIAFQHQNKKGEVKDDAYWNELEGGVFCFSVVEERTTLVNGELKTEKKLVHGDQSMIDNETYLNKIGAATQGTYVTYSMDNLYGAMVTEPYSWRGNGYYKLWDQSDEITDQAVWVQLSRQGKVSVCEEEPDQETLDYEFDKGANDPEIDKNQIIRYVVYTGLNDRYVDNQVGAKLNTGESDFAAQIPALAGFMASLSKNYMPIFVISIVLFVLSIALLCTVAGHRIGTDEIELRMVDRMPYVLYFILVCSGVGGGIAAVIGSVMGILMNIFSVRDGLLLGISMIVGCTLLAAAFCMSTATRIKAKKFWRYTICYYLAKPFVKLNSGVRELHKKNKNTFLKVAIIIGLLTLLEFAVIVGTDNSADSEIVLFFIYKIAEIPLVFWVVAQIERIRQGAKRAASGDYTQPIDTTKMFPAFKEMSENINHVSDGIADAVEEQMKSERMKTELITNVSHDIKTPLTSIINYVDLIKKENVDNTTVQEYVEVLDRQSARLKKLIEDLLEVSKASTGNVEVHMEACDPQVMISQIVGEYQEKMQQQGLELVVGEPEVATTIMADGRHLWRVLDNVMSNIYKYAQENTRVYVDTEVGLHQVKLIFKNISKYPLNITSDELMERFVRGDSSRNTEGHGLGLSIAQSLTQLMGGTMELEIDGDLFKVVVTMNRTEK